jgi:hypothetical protein
MIRQIQQRIRHFYEYYVHYSHTEYLQKRADFTLDLTDQFVQCKTEDFDIFARKIRTRSFRVFVIEHVSSQLPLFLLRIS